MSLVAVIDIGKTNKKVALFDADLQQIAHRQAPFPAQLDAQGVLCEQTDAIWAWLKTQLAELYCSHPFAALSITTHGAAWAALNARRLLGPTTKPSKRKRGLRSISRGERWCR